MATNEELIGREEVDDLESILSITNTDVDAVLHTVADNSDALFTWDYERSRPALGKLYEKAKKSQWNAQIDLPWETEVDQEAVSLLLPLPPQPQAGVERQLDGELPLAGEVGREVAHQLLKPFQHGPVVVGDVVVEEDRGPVEDVDGGGVEYRRLARKVVEEGARRDLHGGGDLLDGGRVVTLLEEEAGGLPLDGLPRPQLLPFPESELGHASPTVSRDASSVSTARALAGIKTPTSTARATDITAVTSSTSDIPLE